MSNVKYAVVPVASCQFNKQTLTFSRAAYDSIKEFCFWTWHNPDDDPLDKVNIGKKDDEILKYVWTRKEKYNACANFFENFGSHVNVGVVHLGGILTWKSVFSGETTSASGSIKNLVTKSLQAHVKANIGLAVGGNMEISASKHKRKLRKQAQFKEDDISKTILSCTVYGGSAGATSTEDWQKSLSEDYASWSIVDRGDQSSNDHVGVWDILKNDTQFYDFYKNYKDNLISDHLKRASSNSPELAGKTPETHCLNTSVPGYIVRISHTYLGRQERIRPLVHILKLCFKSGQKIRNVKIYPPVQRCCFNFCRKMIAFRIQFSAYLI